jgi:hypothetical protein
MAKYRDIITGGLAVVFAVLLFALSFGIKDFSSVRLGPDFVPRLTAGFLGILGVILLVQGLRPMYLSRKNPAREKPAPAEETGKSGHGVLLSFLLLGGYIALLDSVGFIITTTVYLFLQMILLSHETHRRYVLFALISAGTAVAAYYLFVGFFEVMIPAGILG